MTSLSRTSRAPSVLYPTLQHTCHIFSYTRSTSALKTALTIDLNNQEHSPEDMDLDPSYILAVMKCAPSSGANPEPEAPILIPTCPRSKAIQESSTESNRSRRRRANSDPIGYDDGEHMAKRLKLLHPGLSFPQKPLVSRLPHWEPPPMSILGHSRFDHLNKAQKKFKEMANGNQRDLTWKTRHVDAVVEALLLKTHYDWAVLAGDEAFEVGETDDEGSFFYGLAQTLHEDLVDVIQESLDYSAALGKTKEDTDELTDFIKSVALEGYSM